MNPYPWLLPCLFCAGFVHAACGSTFCTVNTHWDTQGLSHDSGWLMDLRYSYAKANQWRTGSSGQSLEEPSGSDEEIESKRTINQMINLSLDYAINRHWGVGIGLPFVVRNHSHILDASVSGPTFQQGKFSEFGDMRVLGRYKFAWTESDVGAAIRFGLKLPTGKIHKTMSPPDPNNPGTPYALERAGQPGTGSTDGIIGLNYFQNALGNSSGWFVNGQLQFALSSRDRYRPGTEVSLDLGMHYEIAQSMNLLLQFNAQRRTRDSGSNANPASGGRTFSVSPGLSYALSPQTLLYAFLQVPLYQYVNADPVDPASGQLTARKSASLGISQRF